MEHAQRQSTAVSYVDHFCYVCCCDLLTVHKKIMQMKILTAVFTVRCYAGVVNA